MTFKNIVLLISFLTLFTPFHYSIGLKLDQPDKGKSISFGGFQSPFAKKEYVKVSTSISHTSIEQNREFYVAFQFNMDEQWHIYGAEEKVGKVTKATLDSTGFEIIEQILSPSKKHEVKIGTKTLTSYFLLNESILVVKLKATSNQAKLKLKLEYQPCTNDSCMMPTSKSFEYDIKYGDHLQKLQKKPFKGILKNSMPAQNAALKGVSSETKTTPKVTKQSKSKEKSKDKLSEVLKKGGLWAIIMAFLWGLMASLTPCVYPMIPITVSLFSGEENSSLFKRFSKALVYVLGIVLVYAVLGLLTAKLGQDLGSWMAKPIVVWPIVILMLALSLSMFGFFELDLPYSVKEKLNSVEGDNYIALFFMGAAMGFVAAPCVGPFAGAIITWLIQNPNSPIFGFFLMASFGLGMGTLFIVIAVFSQNILPRSGMWMIRVKQIMGYVLIGMAFYFAKVFLADYTIDMFTGFYLVVAGSLMGAFVQLSWDDEWWKKVSKAIGLVVFAWGLVILAKSNAMFPTSTVASAPAAVKAKKIKVFTDHDRAKRYAKKTKKPTFMYFGAKWCIPCRIIKKKVLKDPKVLNELSRFSVAYIDCTDAESKGAKVKRDKYKSVAMPYFIFYDSKGKLLKKKEINGKVNAKDLLKVLKSVR
ncbi:MAG: sulfite exporter TauE/SafE family protein [Candidatus Cloacimonetes bacterium]|nr:sulfite exporter TauE/SafE family protein [Candidatus Cloacimonadota bacterium]